MKIRVLSILLLVSHIALKADIENLAIPLPNSGDKIFIGLVETRQKQLEKIKAERDQMAKNREEQTPTLVALIDEVKAHIGQLDKQLEQFPDSEFFKRKISILNDSYQVFKDIQRERDKAIDVLDELIKQLHEYLEDPDFNSLRKEQKLNERLFYSFEDIQRLYNLILDQEKKVSLLTDQEKHIAVELDNRKRAAASTKESFLSKKQEIGSARGTAASLDVAQAKQLVALEERLFTYKRILDGLRVKGSEFRQEFLLLQLSIAKAHLGIYKDYLRIIKPAVRVSEADIVAAREELAKTRTVYREGKERLRLEIDRLRLLQNRVEQELDDRSKQFNVVVGQDLDEWSREPQQTPDAYLAYCEVGVLNEQKITLARKQELLDAQIELEDEKLRDQAIRVHVKETYHKKFNTEEEITAELKKYEAPRSESQAGLSRYKEKINYVADALNREKKVIDNIQLVRQNIIKQKETTFKSRSADYSRCLDLLRRAEDLEKEQMDILSKLTGVYSGLTSVINNKIRLINFITGELESRTIWYRPDYAITWDGVRNIIPDVVNFMSYVRSYFTKGNALALLYSAREVVKQPVAFLIFLIKLLAVGVGLLIIKNLIPRIINVLMALQGEPHGIARMITYLFAGMLQFMEIYFAGMSVWLLLYCALLFHESPDSYLYILFYLLSIPYLLFLINRFIAFMSAFNKEHDYSILAEDFQGRFFTIMAVLLYSSTTIYFFREAFVLAHYYRSELPTILLAINFIIFQVALILLIDKEQILGLIPTRSELWQLIHDQVDRFYYLILLFFITIIVMSNPYVGFGRLVLYVFFGFIYTGVLISGLLWVHGLFKQTAAQVFFSKSDEGNRERFSNAKTWFGLIVIASFLILSFLGLVIGAKIWGWPITFSKVTELLSLPILGGETENAITFLSIFNILLFVSIGFLIAYALNKFILDRIFDLLLVDPGVQHTITSITQYLVIIAAVFLGFQSAKLGALINIIVGALILGLGWVLKEPISDFVAYFIILVQRPVKIGDFIKIDNEITGVVRQITARSVILRRKNSTTLIVPNSYVISHTVSNWNYTRNFIAFDDIIITIDYQEDPTKVKELLYNIVESHPNILKNPKPWIRLDEFGEYGYVFMVRGFLSSVYTLEKWEIASVIRMNIAKAFREQGIKIAVPTRMLLTRADKIPGALSDRVSDR